MKVRLRPVVLILAVLSLVSACLPPAPPLPASLGERKTAEEPAAVRQKIRQHLAADNHPAALALVVSSGLADTALAEEYGLALRGVLKQAEGYQGKDLPEKAGPLYRAALDGYPATPAIAAKAGMRPAGITAGIEACADQLLERGLAAYRRGDLDQAIRTWKLIHVFAPQHQASRKALQTAEVQLANLKKVRAEN
jgi:tetratricopeptide (TPR) repeat protein